MTDKSATVLPPAAPRRLGDVKSILEKAREARVNPLARKDPQMVATPWFWAFIGFMNGAIFPVVIRDVADWLRDRHGETEDRACRS